MHFDVKIGHYYTNIGSISKFLKGVLWTNLTFSWFADTHALWATVKLQKYYKMGGD
ncbi:hypothetical protein C5S35_03120 [Candidatus Methanophagaceae archaeon]|nr:hypothetical protein C5S35_03120 [Methanophagales archaeon]